MQQYEDKGKDGDTMQPSEGVLNDAEEGEETTPRNEKPSNNRSSPIAVATNGGLHKTESDDEEYEEREPPPPRLANGGGGGGGYWRQGAASRPQSPSALTMADNASEASSMMPPARPKSRVELATSRYSNLSYWRARRVIFYKNGDPFFPGIEFRFKPGRDIGTLESLLDKLSLRMDLPRGARYIFSMDGDRKFRLDELEDGASYVVSSYKTFKVSRGRKFKRADVYKGWSFPQGGGLKCQNFMRDNATSCNSPFHFLLTYIQFPTIYSFFSYSCEKG